MDSAVRADNEKWIYDHFLPISEKGRALIDGLNDDLKLARSTLCSDLELFLKIKFNCFFLALAATQQKLF